MPTRYIQADTNPVGLDSANIPPNVAAIGVDLDTGQLEFNYNGTINYVQTGTNPAVTKTAASALTAADAGKIIFLNSTTGFITTLPLPSVGLQFTIINKLANTSGNHTVVTASSANIIKGQQHSAAGDAGDTGTADDTISFVANSSVAGDRVSLVSDGTSWFALGFSTLAASLTFTQAS